MKSVALYRPMDMVDQLMDSFFDSPFVRFSGNPLLNKQPAVDVQETADAYLVAAELPGFDEKQIKVQVEGGKLTIESSKDEEKKEDGNYLIRERRNISFSRSFTLPDNADPEAVSAVFKNGMLSLEIKKRTGSARKLIEIKTE